MQNLSDEFDALARQTWNDRATRLPMLVGRLFERDGYQPSLRSRAATPRDADLFASALDEHYLIEVKSGSKPAGIDVVDELWLRLQQLPTYVTGVIVSRTQFTRAAVKQVESRRGRPIALINGEELAELFRGGLALRSLLRQKKADLMRDAAVRFFDQVTPVLLPPRDDRGILPVGNVRRLGGDDWSELAIALGDHATNYVFADEVPDVDWTISLGVGAGLDVDLPIRSLDELAGVAEVLRRGGWLTPNGRWAIHQLPVSWHGAGARSLLADLRDQSARYAAVGDLQLHSSEQVVYFDHYAGGLYTLVLRMLAGTRPRILDAQLSVQLPGVPLDTFNLLTTLRGLGVDERAVFRSLHGQQRVESASFRLGEVPLEVVGELALEDGTVDPETWVRALVVRNPFGGSAGRRLPDELASALGTPDLIVCSLSSWYSRTRRPASFSLVRVEGARTASALALRFVANWDDTRSTHPAILPGGSPRST